MDFDQPPVVRVDLSPDAALAPGQWPLTIPAVAQVAREGMDLAKGAPSWLALLETRFDGGGLYCLSDD